jgi:hypothetical protein
MGSAFPTSDTTPHAEHFVEVIGSDGILHHVGPFKLLCDAQRWLEQNAQTDGAQLADVPFASIGVIPQSV